jgi:hypothetical protein
LAGAGISYNAIKAGTAMLGIVALLQVQAPRVTLAATPAAMFAGDSTILSWEVSGASSIFISHLGVVGSSGRSAVRPSETVTYTVVAEGLGGITRRSVTVIVTGARGGEAFPDPSNYQNRYSYRVAVRALPLLLDRVHSALQNRLHYSVREAQERDSTFVFHTALLVQPDLLTSGDHRIAARRLSFRVTVPRRVAGSGPFEYTIETLIEYRRRLEELWRFETDALMHESQARRLADLISGLP